MSRKGGDNELETLVDVRPGVAVHLSRDEVLIDELRNLGIAVGLLIHDVAPMAPDGSDVQKNRAVHFFCQPEGLFSPGLPMDRRMCRLSQVRTWRIRQLVLQRDILLRECIWGKTEG